MAEERKNIVDSLVDSGRDALSFRNIMMRILFFLFFGIILGLRSLIKNLDKVGQTGGGVLQYLKALAFSTYSGVGISLSSVWTLISQWNVYIQNNSYGSLIIGIIMGLAVVGFMFQPVSLIVNIIDLKGKKETGNASGQATGFLLRTTFTVIIVLILSAIVFYSGVSETLLSNPETTEDDSTPTEEINNSENSSITNTIDMLSGGG